MSGRRMAVRAEKVEQAQIVQLLRALGGKVYVSGTTRRRGDYAGTMQTPGIPDVEAFLPRRDVPGKRLQLKVECKSERGRLRPEQAEYRELCAQAGVEHVVGTLDAVIAWCVDRGYLRAQDVPHYRRPKCDHKFVDSAACLKCGWRPADEVA